MEATRDAVDQSQYLTFYLAGEEYAIDILQVKEVLEYDTLTPVPRTPPSIRGVINLRGNVVPVVDLGVKFGLPEMSISKRTCIVIVEVELHGDKTVMGVMADAVSRVMDLSSADIEEAPSFGTQVQVDYLRGLGKVDKRFVLILDIERVLSAEELAAAGSLLEKTPEKASAVEDETAPTEEAESLSDEPQGEEASAP